MSYQTELYDVVYEFNFDLLEDEARNAEEEVFC